MKKRTLIALGLLLASALGLTATAGYLTFARSAENPPAEACGGGRPRSGPVVVAAGASMTQGTLGAIVTGLVSRWLSEGQATPNRS